MADREDKLSQIIEFVRKHPESFATRTMMRRFLGANWEITSSDYEISDELIHRFESKLRNPKVNEDEIDSCYDIIK